MKKSAKTHMKCIQAVHDKLKVQNDFHLTKLHSAAFSRFSISGVDSYLSSGLARSENWTRKARDQARGERSMSRKHNLNGYSSSISWQGMIAFTNSATIPECFGSLAIYCAESSNPSKCWKKVLVDMYGCEWYPILKKIAELTYNIKLPSDEVQQVRLEKRQDVYEKKLSTERAKQKKNKVYVLPEPLEPGVSLVVYITNLLIFTRHSHIFFSFIGIPKLVERTKRFVERVVESVPE